MLGDDDPRLHAPGPPGGERYMCPVGGCRWHLDVPAPEVEGLERLGDDAVLTVREVPMAAVEAALAAHLRGHDEGDLGAAMVTALRALS